MFAGAMCDGKPTEWWFPERTNKTSSEMKIISQNQRTAVTLCRNCPASAECLDYSLENREMGIWGGMGEKLRKRARRMKLQGYSSVEIIRILTGGLGS